MVLFVLIFLRATSAIFFQKFGKLWDHEKNAQRMTDDDRYLRAIMHLYDVNAEKEYAVPKQHVCYCSTYRFSREQALEGTKEDSEDH